MYNNAHGFFERYISKNRGDGYTGARFTHPSKITLKKIIMKANKKVDEKNTLAYAVAFHFSTSGTINFLLGSKMYQHINTVYDRREDGRGYNTIEVVYNYKAQKYEVLCVSDEKIGSKEIVIL